MEKNLHDIDKLFQSFLESYEEDPAEKVWASIENDLNRADAAKYKAKYKFLLRTVASIALLLTSLLLNDIIQIYNYDLKRNDTSINRLTAKSSTQKNAIENKSNNKMSNHAYVTKRVNDNLYTFKNDSLNNIESAEHIIFQGDELYNHNMVLSLDSVTIFNKKNKFLSPEDLPSFNIAPRKRLHFSEQVLEKNLIADGQRNKQGRRSLQLNSKHDFYLIPFFSYDVVTAHLQEQYKYDNQDQLAVSSRERPDPSYTIGLLAEYRLSKKYSLQAGISLSNSFTSIDSTVVRAMPDNAGTYRFKLATTYGLAEMRRTGINPRSGDSIRLDDASLHLQYISVPVIIKYQIKPGNFNISGLAGVGVNRLIKEKMEVEYVSNTDNETEVVEKIEGLKKTFITFIAGGEASYNISERISIGLSPMIRYSLTPVNEGTPIKTFPVNISAAALVKIKM
jgi:Outer membrane protein beta-barrel domain